MNRLWSHSLIAIWRRTVLLTYRKFFFIFGAIEKRNKSIEVNSKRQIFWVGRIFRTLEILLVLMLILIIVTESWLHRENIDKTGNEISTVRKICSDKKSCLSFRRPRCFFLFFDRTKNEEKFKIWQVGSRAWHAFLETKDFAKIWLSTCNIQKDLNILLLGLGFLFVYTAYQTTAAVSETVLDSYQQETGNVISGYVAMALNYAGTTVVALLVPGMLLFITRKTSVIIGSILSITMAASYIYPTAPRQRGRKL